MNCVHSCAARIGAAFALLALPVAFGTSADKHYSNPNYKFSLNVFNEWTEVPPTTGQENPVASWYEPGSKSETIRPSLTIFRVSHRGDGNGVPEGPVTGDEPKLPKAAHGANEKAKIKDVYTLAFGQISLFDARKWPEEKNWKEVTSRDRVKGKLWSIEIPLGAKATPDETLLAQLFVYEKDGVEYGTRLVCSARRKETYEPVMRGIAKSFLFFDEKAKEVPKISLLDGINLSDKRKSEIEKGLIGGWDVILSPKKNYVVVFNTKGGNNRELAHVLADRIEKIREQIYEKQFPPAHPVDAVSVMRVCGDAAEYRAYGGPPNTAGYWNSASEELVFYDSSRTKKIDENTLCVLYHEAFHQYIFYSVGSVAPHSWFNEGHGDYYAGARFGTSRFVIGPFSWRVGVLKAALAQGPRKCTVETDDKGVEHKKWGSTGYTPLKDLVAFTQQEYYSYPSVSYAQGWSLIYFLREEVPKKKEWNAKWGRILPTYFDVLKREVNGTASGKANPRAGGDEGPPSPKPPAEPPTAPPDEPKTPKDPDGPKDPPTDPPKDPPTDPKDPPAEPPKDPKPDGGGDEPPADPGFQPMQKGDSSAAALEAALREAFQGVNFDELEAAWRETMKRVKA